MSELYFLVLPGHTVGAKLYAECPEDDDGDVFPSEAEEFRQTLRNDLSRSEHLECCFVKRETQL